MYKIFVKVSVLLSLFLSTSCSTYKKDKGGIINPKGVYRIRNIVQIDRRRIKTEVMKDLLLDNKEAKNYMVSLEKSVTARWIPPSRSPKEYKEGYWVFNIKK